MGHKANKRLDRLFDALTSGGGDYGEVGIFLIAAIAVMAMPWTIFRLARAAWVIENQQGRTDHHRRIVGMLMTNFLVWLGAIAAAVASFWFISIQ